MLPPRDIHIHSQARSHIQAGNSVGGFRFQAPVVVLATKYKTAVVHMFVTTKSMKPLVIPTAYSI